MDTQEEIDLRQVFRVVRRRFWMLVAIVVIAASVSGLTSLYLIAPTYTSSVTLMVAKRESPVLDYTTQLLDRNLVPTYAEIAKSRTVASRVITTLGLEMPVADLQRKIKVTAVNDTQVISISVDAHTPQGAMSTANAVADAFMAQVQGLMKVENVAIVDPAVAPSTASKPRPVLNVVVAAVLGCLMGLALVFLLEFMDNTIKGSPDVMRHLALPVLGTIPLIDLKREQEGPYRSDNKNAQGVA